MILWAFTFTAIVHIGITLQQEYLLQLFLVLQQIQPHASTYSDASKLV